MLKRLMVVGAAVFVGTAVMTNAGAEPTAEEAKVGSGARFSEADGKGSLASEPVPVVAGESGKSWLQDLIGPSAAPEKPSAAPNPNRPIPTPYAPYRDAAEAQWAERLYRTLGNGIAIGIGVGTAAGIGAGVYVGGALAVVGLGFAGAAVGVIAGGVGALLVLRSCLRNRAAR